jgi:hypothetical protein
MEAAGNCGMWKHFWYFEFWAFSLLLLLDLEITFKVILEDCMALPCMVDYTNRKGEVWRRPEKHIKNNQRTLFGIWECLELCSYFVKVFISTVTRSTSSFDWQSDYMV